MYHPSAIKAKASHIRAKKQTPLKQSSLLFIIGIRQWFAGCATEYVPYPSNSLSLSLSLFFSFTLSLYLSSMLHLSRAYASPCVRIGITMALPRRLHSCLALSFNKRWIVSNAKMKRESKKHIIIMLLHSGYRIQRTLLLSSSSWCPRRSPRRIVVVIIVIGGCCCSLPIDRFFYISFFGHAQTHWFCLFVFIDGFFVGSQRLVVGWRCDQDLALNRSKTISRLKDSLGSRSSSGSVFDFKWIFTWYFFRNFDCRCLCIISLSIHQFVKRSKRSIDLFNRFGANFV